MSDLPGIVTCQARRPAFPQGRWLLKRGGKSDAVKALQRALNKVWPLLLVDGDFGSATEAAVADARVALGRPRPPQTDEDLQSAVGRLPEPSPELTALGVTFIRREEVTSPGEYRRRYKARFRT